MASTITLSNLTQEYNVRSYGAVGDGVTDDTAAINSAIAAAVKVMSKGHVGTILFPGGQYKITSAPWGTFRLPIRIRGDGSNRTFIIVDTSFSGDVFSWSECWYAASITTTAINLSAYTGGPHVVGLSIIGDRSTANTQNALVFYDRCDEVLIFDVGIQYMTGRAIYSGVLKNTTQAYMRESRMAFIFCRHCGNTSIPAVEFNSVGTGNGTDEIDVFALSIFAPRSVGLLIASQGSAAVVYDMRFTNLRIEGLQDTQGGNLLSGDLLQVGSSSQKGLVNNLFFDNCFLLNPYPSSAGISFNAVDNTVIPYQIYFKGTFGGGAPQGNGIVINAGRLLFFDVPAMYTGSNTNLIIADSTLVPGKIIIDARAQTWTSTIDASVAANILAPTTHQFP